MKTLGVVALVLGAPGLARAQADGRERLTVEDAVRVALQANDGVRASRERKDAAADTAYSVRGRLLPTFVVSDQAQWFKSPLSITLPPSGPGGKPTDLTFKDLSANLLSVSAQQPLLGLLHLTQDFAAANRSADSASDNEKVAESAIRENVESSYLRLFQARALEDVARASEQQLADQAQVAKAKFQAGVLTTADLLRIQVAQANARLQEIQAEVQERTTRAALLTLLGRNPSDTGVEFLEPTSLESAALPTRDNNAVQEEALSQRPEVAAAAADASAASHRQWATLFELLPEVNVQGSYIKANARTSAGSFPTIDVGYVGVAASWPFWQWGTGFFAHRAAAHQATAAALAAEDTRRAVSVDASTKLELAKASAAAMDVAQATIASAEEAFRVTEALVKAGSATTTDLLDAQSALTQAKLNLVRARYDQAIALVALTRATGGGH